VTAPVFSAGTIVAGRYTIESLLGKRRGRATYRAICAPNRHVALKMLDPQLAGSEEEQALVQAATVASELPEGAVLGMIDYGIDAESGAPFFVSPLSDHPSLEAFVSLCPLSLNEMATMARSLARGMDSAHRRGLAHLAMRPTNVFVGPPPVCWTRVSDFGAGAVDRASEEGGERDTLAFAAPELYAGTHGPLSAQAAARADVFSAALLCFYAATGDTYWKATRKRGGGAPGPHIDPLVKETTGVRAPTSVAAKEIGVAWDPKLDAPFARALSHSPAARFGSVGELAEALAEALELPSRAGAANLTDQLFKDAPRGGVPSSMDDDDDGPATSVKNVPRIAPPPPPPPQQQQLESVAPPPQSIAPAGPRPGAPSTRGSTAPSAEAPREQRWGGTLVMELDSPAGPPPRRAAPGTMQSLSREMTGPFQVPAGLGAREMTGPVQVPAGLAGTMLLDSPGVPSGSIPAGPLPPPAGLPRATDLGLASERPPSLPAPHAPPLFPPATSTPSPVPADAAMALGEAPTGSRSRGPLVAGFVAAGVLLIGVGGFLVVRTSESTAASSEADASQHAPAARPDASSASRPAPPSTSAAGSPPDDAENNPTAQPSGSSDAAASAPAPEPSGPIPTTLGQQPKPRVDPLDPPTTWYAELVVNCEPACSLVLIQGGPALNPTVAKQLAPGNYIVTVQQSGGVQSQSPLLRAATRTTLTFDGRLTVPQRAPPAGDKPKCTGFLRTNCK